jgi:hypothetical protein
MSSSVTGLERLAADASWLDCVFLLAVPLTFGVKKLIGRRG